MAEGRSNTASPALPGVSEGAESEDTSSIFSKLGLAPDRTRPPAGPGVAPVPGGLRAYPRQGPARTISTPPGGLVGIGMALTDGRRRVRRLVAVTPWPARRGGRGAHNYAFTGISSPSTATDSEVRSCGHGGRDHRRPAADTTGCTAPSVEERIDGDNFPGERQQCTADVAFPCHVAGSSRCHATCPSRYGRCRIVHRGRGCQGRYKYVGVGVGEGPRPQRQSSSPLPVPQRGP